MTGASSNERVSGEQVSGQQVSGQQVSNGEYASAPKRVLMVSQPTVAGVAQCVVDWSAGIREYGWEPVVACPSDGELAGWCEALAIPVRPWESVRSPTSGVAGELSALRRIIADVDPDVVMLHSSKAGLVGRLALRGARPTVFVPHAWSFDAVTGPMAIASRSWERLAAHRTDLVVCVSAAEYRTGVAAKIRTRYQVVRNGVDVAALRDLADGSNILRDTLGLTSEDTLVVCLGRLSTQKGQDVLLRAWPSVQVPGAQAVLVGDGPEEEALRELAAGDATVRFAGGVPRAEAVRFLAAADVVVVPSRWEGMALVPLEAMAVGAPVIASDVTGVREAVDATVGAVVPPDDPEALARAITRQLRLSGEDQHRMRMAAAQRVADRFSLQRTVQQVAAALDDSRERRRV